MGARRRHSTTAKGAPAVAAGADPQGMAALAAAFEQWMQVHHYSAQTIEGRRQRLRCFTQWCAERGVTLPSEVTPAVLERYRAWLYHYRKRDGKPLSFGTQQLGLAVLRAFFKWLTRSRLIVYNPASELQTPRREKTLPRDVLSAAQAERVINQTNSATVAGIRDRAILETLYSTGMRRLELVRLEITDLDLERRTVLIRLGKGRCDRLIPIGQRAVAWVERYLEDVRPAVATELDQPALFLTEAGQPLRPKHLTRLVHAYVEAAEIGKRGACHIFRHTMATLMLENGADVRFVQQMLGHSELSTTAIYTRVTIGKLQQVHAATHPAKMHRTDRTEPGADAEIIEEGADCDSDSHSEADRGINSEQAEQGAGCADDDPTELGPFADGLPVRGCVLRDGKDELLPDSGLPSG